MSEPQALSLLEEPKNDSQPPPEPRPTISPLKVEDHMLSIASMLFDALSELPKNGDHSLPTIDQQN